MPPNDEPNATGMANISGIEPREGRRGRRSKSRAAVSSQVDISLPKVDALSKSIDNLVKSMSKLRDMMASFSAKKVGNKMASEIDAVSRAGASFTGAGSGGGGGDFPSQPNVWQSRPNIAQSIKIPLAQAVHGAGGGGGGAGGGPSPLPVTSAGRGDVAGASAMGAGIGQIAGNLGGAGGIGGLVGSAIMGLPQLYGALAGGSLQYTYNRINGPQGNMNAMLQAANVLAPNVTMMNAAGARMPGGGRMGIQGAIEGLAQRMPIMGTQQDMLQTIQAGQSVGALMAGTPGRAGFFESARQAQVLMPGQAPGQIAGNIAGYMQNVGAQQRGAVFGEGAFTMIGQGGRYKTLAEWAHGITEFLEQHRPGGAQGKNFTKEELITQNFPGSNINTWFQFMGVPQGMVDYWWQYVLTVKGGVAASKITSDILQQGVQKARGINLGFEQLRTATQSTRRDFLFGNQMYSMYNANAAANRRFNVAMQGTDQDLAQKLQGTNMGRMLALLPTPILELLMPVLTQFFSSPVGGIASGVGSILGIETGESITGKLGGFLGGAATRAIPGLGSIAAVGDMAGGVADLFGDPMPYGDTGGTNLSHLSPDLARKVGMMMKANPNLKVSSGYRDTSTQNRLRAKGATAVGSNKSAHTRGWAVDIGPASQMGWLMGNAGKFGLQTAAGYGEPWHIQQSGTPLVGDPGSAMPYGGIGDFLSGVPVVGGLLGGAMTEMAQAVAQGIAGVMKAVMEPLMDPITALLQKFIGSGGFTSMIDAATGMFSRLLTGPLEGMMELFGKAEGGGQGELMDLINRPVNVRVPVVGSGFSSSGTGISASPIFGDPLGPMSLASSSPAGGGPSVIIFQAPISISGGAGSGIDARRLASQLASHLEEEVNKRQWLVS